MLRHHVRSYGNNKIMAIKLVRELTHCGLAEAKNLVESHSGFFVRALPDAQARVVEEARRYGIEFDPPLDGTVASASEQELEPDEGGCSVRYVSGTHAIMAIKLVRELTGLGLKQAKDVVDNATWIRTGLSRPRAEEIVRRFEEIGARVELRETPSLSPPSARGYDEDEDEDDF